MKQNAIAKQGQSRERRGRKDIELGQAVRGWGINCIMENETLITWPYLYGKFSGLMSGMKNALQCSLFETHNRLLIGHRNWILLVAKHIFKYLYSVHLPLLWQQLLQIPWVGGRWSSSPYWLFIGVFVFPMQAALELYLYWVRSSQNLGLFGVSLSSSKAEALGRP